MIVLTGVRSQFSYPGGTGSRGVSSDGTLFFRPPEDVSFLSGFPASFEENIKENFEAATIAAQYVVKNRTEKEKTLVEKNIFIQPNTPASYHLNLFQSPPETIASGARGMLDLQKSIHLASKYSSSFQVNSLTVEQGLFALSNVMASFLSSSAQQLSRSQPADSLTCPYDEVLCPNSNSTFRTINGSCNNLKKPSWGMINTALQRLIPSKYDDGMLLYYNKILTVYYILFIQIYILKEWTFRGAQKAVEKSYPVHVLFRNS